MGPIKKQAREHIPLADVELIIRVLIHLWAKMVRSGCTLIDLLGAIICFDAVRPTLLSGCVRATHA